MPYELLTDILSDGVRRNPEGTAVREPGAQITYRELDGLTNRIARAHAQREGRPPRAAGDLRGGPTLTVDQFIEPIREYRRVASIFRSGPSAYARDRPHETVPAVRMTAR
jgi:acyl-CoA synthetase (AMP-forming)/AMP-acid ligase II